jgi:two-component system, LytTR family, response regulator
MKAIIVDDEASARLTLRAILEEFFKEVVIVGEADSPASAVQLIEDKNPNLVFLDIQMQSGTGFDVLESLDKRNFQVVFISAHKQHAFDSFRFNAADYLLKPVRIKDLRVAIEKVKEILKASGELGGDAMLRHITQDQSQLQLIIPEMEGFTVVRLSELIRCESSRNYTDFYLTGNRQVTASKGLKEFEDLLIPNGFIRIHKSHVINMTHLSRYIKGRGGEVVMSDDKVLPVSRERKDPLVDTFIQM